MLLQRIELENLLSFKHVDLELQSLNVLIGANATGKSNLIKALALVHSLPINLQAEIVRGGGPRGWINQRIKQPAKLKLNGDLGSLPFEYELVFQESGQAYSILQEYYALVFYRNGDRLTIEPVGGKTVDYASPNSVLSEFRHPSEPEIGRLGAAFSNIRLYREFKTGPDTQARGVISIEFPGDRLERHAVRWQLKDPHHDGGFPVVDHQAPSGPGSFR